MFLRNRLIVCLLFWYTCVLIMCCSVEKTSQQSLCLFQSLPQPVVPLPTQSPLPPPIVTYTRKILVVVFRLNRQPSHIYYYHSCVPCMVCFLHQPRSYWRLHRPQRHRPLSMQHLPMPFKNILLLQPMAFQWVLFSLPAIVLTAAMRQVHPAVKRSVSLESANVVIAIDASSQLRYRPQESPYHPSYDFNFVVNVIIPPIVVVNVQGQPGVLTN